jgi:hypothetical protein
MNPKLLFPFAGTAATLVAAALAANVVACGGLDEDTRLTLATQQPQAAARTAPLPSLIADDGTLPTSLAEAVPADLGARTRSGRYALHAQATALDFERRGDVVWVDAGCCAFDAADTAVGIVHGLRAAADVSPDAPVLVKGTDLRLAAFVANRLEEEGERRVFLVTR